MKLSEIYGNDVLERRMPTEQELVNQSQQYEPTTSEVLKSYVSDTFKGQGSLSEFIVKSDVEKTKKTGTPITKEEFDAMGGLRPALKYTPDMTKESVEILNDYHYQRDLNAEIQSKATTRQSILGFTTGLASSFLEPKQLTQGIIAGVLTGGVGAVGSKALKAGRLYSANATKRAIQVGAVSTAIEGVGAIPLDVNTAKTLQTDYDYTNGVIDAFVGGAIGTGVDIGINKYTSRKARIKAEKTEQEYQTKLREDNPFDFSVLDTAKNRNLDADVLNALISNNKEQDAETGLYGFLQSKPNVIAQYGITNQSTLKDQIDAFAQYTADNVSFLESSLERDVTATETSLADFIGKNETLSILQADANESFLQHMKNTDYFKNEDGTSNARSFLKRNNLPKNATIGEVINYSNGKLKKNLGASPYIPMSKDLMEKIDFKTERAMADRPVDMNQLVAVQVHKNYQDGLKFLETQNKKLVQDRQAVNAINNNQIDDLPPDLLFELDAQYAENIETKIQEFRNSVAKVQSDSGITASETPTLLEIDNEFYKAEFKNLNYLRKQARNLKNKIEAFNLDEQINATATETGTPINTIKAIEEEITNYPLLRQVESDKLTSKRKRIFDAETQTRVEELKSDLAFIKSDTAGSIKKINQTAKNQFKSLLSQYNKIQYEMQAKSQALLDYSETAQNNAENIYRQSVLNDLDVLNNPIYDKDLINGLNEITERIDAEPDLETQVKKSRAKRVKKPVEAPQEEIDAPKAEQTPPPMTPQEIVVNQKQKRITDIEAKIKSQLQQAQIPNTETKHYVNLLSSIDSRAYDRTANSPEARQALDKMFDNLNIRKQNDADSVVDAGTREFLQETQNDLLVQHNISLDGLMFANKIGGLPIPSIGVAKKDMPLSNFGAITLIADKSLVDPTNKENQIYGADIYSPRYPRVSYQVNEKSFDKILNTFDDFNGFFDKQSKEKLRQNLKDNGINDAQYSPIVKFNYLKSIGKKIDAPFQKEKESIATESNFSEYVGVDKNELINSFDFKQKLKKYLQEQVSYQEDAGSFIKKVKEKNKNEYFENNELRQGTINEHASFLQNYKKDTRIDAFEFEKNLREATENDKGFKDFIKKTFNDIVEKETIESSGKDVPHTIDNVIKVMLKNGLVGTENINYGLPSVRAKFTKKFKSIKDIKENKDLILSKNDFEKVKTEIENDFLSLQKKLQLYEKQGYSDAFQESFFAFSKNKQLEKTFNEHFKDAPDSLKKEYVDFIEKLKIMPTEYFEAKITRKVDLSEFKGAIVPKDKVYDKAVKVLQENGITDIQRYDSDETRFSNIDYFKNLFFQKQGKGKESIKRGSFVALPNNISIINVFKDRDKSTILHETGHFLLETYKSLARTADAPQGIVDDWKELENWLGIKDDTITTDAHEKFARGFEAYLMTGEAPSLTLLDMFRQFKQWLSEIYKDIKNLNVSLTPQAKSLFDRMLASPEETITINQKKVQNSNADIVNIRVSPNETIPAKLIVVEADDLITSNLDDGRVNTQYPKELQPRDRSSLASQNQVLEIAKNIDPDVLIHGTSASHGTPIIGDDFVVDSGNGRAMAIRKAIDVNKQGYDTYKQTLIDNGYDLTGFKSPVLVRMRTNKMNTADRIKFTQKANQSTIAKMSVSEQAFIDKDAFDNETLSLYKGGKITELQNKDFVLSFAQKNVSPNDMNDFVTKNGVLSNNGKTRIESALLAKALNNKKIVADYFETTDPDLKSVLGGLSDSAPNLAYLNNNPNYDLSKHISEAIETIKKSRKDKIPVSELVQQTDLERGDVSDLTKQVLRAMHRKDDLKQIAGREKISAIFSDYSQRAIYNDFAEGDIFGEVVTSLDYLKGAIKTAQKEQEINVNSSDIAEIQELQKQVMQYEKQGLLQDEEIDFIKKSNLLTKYDLIDIEEQATNCLLTGITND